LRFNSLPLALVGTVVLLCGGCATKKYVKNTVDPVSNRVDQVANQTNQQGQTLDATRRDVEHNEQEISATKETARGADARAGDALAAASTAGAKADRNAHDLSQLRNTVANLEDYKPASMVEVPFGFGKYSLTPDAKRELDNLAQNKDQWKRYFIAVEGFTDRTGTDAYNDALSRRRAEKVTQYLIAKYDIPIFRIHMIGMGKSESEQGRAAGAKARRVEVTVYSADAALATTAATPNPASSTPQ
jgi:outer membrane protein OmpA-like peptidoglycan-associated protein